MGNFLRLSLIAFIISVTASCGGGGGDGSKKTSPNTECPDGDTYCNSDYAELRIGTRNDQMWLSLSGENSSLQATPQGRLKGSLEFVDVHYKGVEVWRSTDTSVLIVDENGFIEAVGLGEAEVIYEMHLLNDIIQYARKPLIVKESDENITPTAVVENTEITVTGGETVSLNGSDSFDKDGNITQYEWLVQSGSMAITIVDSDKATASFVAPESKYTLEYIIRLSVTDDEGSVGSKNVTVTVSPSIDNIAPKALADNVEYHQLSKVLLDGSKSSDEDDGTENLTYLWQQMGQQIGQQSDTEHLVIINNADKAVADFIAPEAPEKTILNFKLTVTDPDGAQSSVEITATILPPEENLSPIAKPEFISINGSDISESAKEVVSDDGRITSIKVNEETSVCIEGNKSSDPEDSTNITYLWAETEKAIDGINKDNNTEQQICFETPKLTEEKNIEITLTVTDTETATGKSSIFLKVLPVNATPEVKAEHAIANRTATLTNISEDDGSIESCEWRQNQSDTVKVTITNSDKCEATFPEPITKDGATLSFYLTVTDDEGMTVTNDNPHEVVIDAVDLTPQNVKVEHSYETEDDKETVLSHLVWDDVTQDLNMDETTYKVYWSTSPNVSKTLFNYFTIPNLTLMELKNLTANTAFYYKVTATYPDSTESELSKEAVYLPATQRLFLTEDIKQITINWDAVTGADSYLVSWNKEDGLPQETTVTTNSYTDTNTTAGNQYNYRVTPILNIDGAENKGVRSVEKSYYARGNYWVNANPDMALSWNCGYSGITVKYNGEEKIICLERTELSDGYNNVYIMQFDWKTGASKKITELPEERRVNNFAVATNDDRIYFAGGERKDGNNDYVDVFNFTTMEWEEKILVSGIGNLNVTRLIVDNNKLMVFGTQLGTYCPPGQLCPQVLTSVAVVGIFDMENGLPICSQIFSRNDNLIDYEYFNDALYAIKSSTEFISIDMEGKECSLQILEDLPDDLPLIGTMHKVFDPALGFDALVYRGHQVNDDGSTTPEVWKYHPLAQWYRVAASGKEPYDPGNRYSIINYDNKLIISNLYSAANELFNRTEIFNLQTESWDRKDSGISPRSLIATTKHSGKIYLNGGKGMKVNSFELFDPERAEFEKLPSNELWRFYHSAINVNDAIFLIDGISIMGNNPVFETEKYDISSKTWNVVATKPTVRIGACNVNVNGIIYSLAGMVQEFDSNSYSDITDNKAEISRYVEIFNPKNNEWSIKSSAQIPSSLLSQERIGVSCAAIDNNIYVMGGFNDSKPAIEQVEIYNTTTNTWTTDSELMPEPLSYLGRTNNVVVNDKAYLIGGVLNPGTDPSYSSIVLRYSPYKITNKWEYVKEVPSVTAEIMDNNIYGEAHYSAIALDGAIYKFGGLLYTDMSEILSSTVAKFK